jgi:hypothetical protein
MIEKEMGSAAKQLLSRFLPNSLYAYLCSKNYTRAIQKVTSSELLKNKQ